MNIRTQAIVDVNKTNGCIYILTCKQNLANGSLFLFFPAGTARDVYLTK